MFDNFLPIPDAESLPFYPLVLKLVVCVHETLHTLQIQVEALSQNEVLHNQIEESVYNHCMSKKYLKTHVEPVVPV